MAEADAAFGLMKEKNVVGPLYRTKELIRALKGLDPVTVPEKEAKPTLQFFKQLKFLTEECEDKSEEGVKVSFDFGEIRGEFRNLSYTRDCGCRFWVFLFVEFQVSGRFVLGFFSGSLTYPTIIKCNKR